MGSETTAVPPFPQHCHPLAHSEYSASTTRSPSLKDSDLTHLPHIYTEEALVQQFERLHEALSHLNSAASFQLMHQMLQSEGVRALLVQFGKVAGIASLENLDLQSSTQVVEQTFLLSEEAYALDTEEALAKFGTIFSEIAEVRSELNKKVPCKWFFSKEMTAIQAKANALGKMFCETFVLAKVPGPSSFVAAGLEDWSNEWSRLTEEEKKQFVYRLEHVDPTLEADIPAPKQSLLDSTQFLHAVLSAVAQEEAGVPSESTPLLSDQDPSTAPPFEILMGKVKNFSETFPVFIRSLKSIDSLFVVLLPTIGLCAWQGSILYASIVAAVIVLARISIWFHTHHYGPRLQEASDKLDAMSKSLNEFLEMAVSGVNRVGNNIEVARLNAQLSAQNKKLDDLFNMVKAMQETQVDVVRRLSVNPQNNPTISFVEAAANQPNQLNEKALDASGKQSDMA